MDDYWVVYAVRSAKEMVANVYPHGYSPESDRHVAFCKGEERLAVTVDQMSKKFPGLTIYTARPIRKLMTKVEVIGECTINEKGEVLPA